MENLAHIHHGPRESVARCIHRRAAQYIYILPTDCEERKYILVVSCRMGSALFKYWSTGHSLDNNSRQRKYITHCMPFLVVHKSRKCADNTAACFNGDGIQHGESVETFGGAARRYIACLGRMGLHFIIGLMQPSQPKLRPHFQIHGRRSSERQTNVFRF